MYRVRADSTIIIVIIIVMFPRKKNGIFGFFSSNVPEAN